MNCEALREQLLASEQPERPGPTLSAHLRRCPACQVWLQRLVRLERQLPRRPIPVPPVPSALFEALEPRPAVLPLRRTPATSQEGARRKAALASSLAAALLLFAFGWWAWPHLRESSPAHLSIYQARRDAQLAQVADPPQKAFALLRLAEEMLGETGPAQAEGFAVAMEELMNIDLPFWASEVAIEQRPALLEQLRQLESRSARLAAQARGERLSRALDQAALSARLTDRRLRTQWGT